MKKIIFSIICFYITQCSFSQDVGKIEKSIFSIQTGILGLWVINETKLSSEIVLHSEFGLDASLFGGDVRSQNTFVLAPILNVEPRWYYNLEKRIIKNKSIKNNALNFLTLSVNYNPDWFVISNNTNANVTSQISLIPKWGIRRNIADSNFNYELGAGFGYRKLFLKKYGFIDNKTESVLDLHVRVGYTS